METLNLERLVEYAVKAPSGHNTQPWTFYLKPNRIEIHPDFKRALPIVDPDNHALYISLGCAVENMVIAASSSGFDSDVNIGDTGSYKYIQINFSANKEIKKDTLFEFIKTRQSTRNKYTSATLPQQSIEELKKSFNFNGVKILLFLQPEEKKIIENYVIEGSNLQFHNKSFVNELVSWIRFSEKEAKAKGDGLWSAAMGLPNIPSFIGNFIMKHIVTPKSEAKRWKKLIRATSGFALFVVDQNNPENCINLGRAFQRFALKATQLNLSHAHVNMPCEESEVGAKMIQKFGLGTSQPLLLIRFGYSPKMPYSFRRNINQVIQKG